ncbi:MAG: nucleotidyltransferase family protein [Acidobacteriota bacterium]
MHDSQRRHAAVSNPSQELRQVARALEGSFADLVELAHADAASNDAEGTSRRQRVPAQLLARARAHGLDQRRDLAPAIDAWRRQTRAAAATHLVLDATTVLVGRALGRAGIDWLPLKGVDLVRRGVYDGAEQRPCGDLDLLIPGDALEAAREALEAAGCVGLASGPRAARYLRDEGYAWQARAPTGSLVELHWRLWGSAPAALADHLVDASRPAPELGPTARQATTVHAWLIAAFHLWLDPPPRAVGRFLDLVQVADTTADDDSLGDAAFRERLIAETEALGLQLPACLAAGVAADLFETARPTHTAILDALGASLRGPERLLFAAHQGIRAADLPTGALAAARLTAGRGSRHGARAVGRRLWPHPGIVEDATRSDASSPWPLRRLHFQARLVGAALRRFGELVTSRLGAFARFRE